MKRAVLTCLMFVGLLAVAPAVQAQVRREIHFPYVGDYQTLKADLHMHSVFSDGQVWPTVRVDEAWRLGLDAIALTDHIEYQPHRDDLPTNHNRPFDLAIGRAREAGILMPKSTEITRDTPPGHFNAIFLNDIGPLDTPDFVEAVKQANEQQAFVFWNHQEWKGPERGQWMEVHTTLYDNKWLHGMEVANGESYYPQAHRWCLEKGLTMIGTSDIHTPDLNQQTTSEEHRTMTLVFAKERTLESLKEALFAGRTVVWYNDQLIGRQEMLEPLFNASVRVVGPYQRTGNRVTIGIANACDVELQLERTDGPGPQTLTLPARATTLVRISTSAPKDAISLAYTATNLLIGPEQSLPVTLTIPGESQ